MTTTTADPAASPAQAASRSRRDKTALVLSGGGITGFLYEVGVLLGFEEAAAGRFGANEFDVYVGTSAGAVLAALLANGARISDIFTALRHDDRESPFNFQPADVFGVASRGPLGLVLDFLRPIPGTVRRAIQSRRWPVFAQIMADYQEHHPPGFYSTEPLQTSLCKRFSRLGFAHSFADCPRELYISGTDLDSGEHLVFGAGEFRDLHICQAVAASCAIPIFFRPIRVGDRDVVDGAVSEGAPVEIAASAGAREIVLLNPIVPIRNDRSRICLPLDGGHCARLAEKGVGWIGEQVMRLVLDIRFHSALQAFRSKHPEIQVTYLEPSRDEALLFLHGVMSFSARKEILDAGRESGRRFFASGVLLERLTARSAASAQVTS